MVKSGFQYGFQDCMTLLVEEIDRKLGVTINQAERWQYVDKEGAIKIITKIAGTLDLKQALIKDFKELGLEINPYHGDPHDAKGVVFGLIDKSFTDADFEGIAVYDEGGWMIWHSDGDSHQKLTTSLPTHFFKEIMEVTCLQLLGQSAAL